MIVEIPWTDPVSDHGCSEFIFSEGKMFMAQTPLAKAPTGPKVSGTRTIVSLVFLVVVLVVCGIELRAGLGQFLTLRSFNKVSENSLFKNVSLVDAQGMVAAFPSKSPVEVGDSEDVHHYYWYSLLRPLMGDKNPELFVSSDHSSPPNAVSFYTSTEGELVNSPIDPNAPPATPPYSTMPPGGPRGMSMSPPGSGPPSGGPPGGGRKGGNASRPPLEDAATDPAATDPPKTEGEPSAPPATEATPTEATPSEPDATTEPAKEDEKPETPAAPN